MDDNQLVQFNQQQALITSRLDAVGVSTNQLQTQLDQSTRDIHRLMSQLDERQKAQSETNQTFESQFTQLGQVLQEQQSNFFEQLNQQNTALQLLISQLGSVVKPVDQPEGSTSRTKEKEVELSLPPELPLPSMDGSIVKTQLPLIPPPIYKGERKDNACEQWCMEMHSFMRRYETLTGKFLTNGQAVEYISQYFADAARTWWTTLIFNVKQGILNAKKPATENELYSKLQENFGDIHSAERRREKYESLKQTGSVQDFANKLKHTVLFLDPIPPAYEILRRFQNGLRSDIRAKMDEFHGDIKTLDEYIHKADDIDRTMYRLKQSERRKDANQSPERGRSYAMGSQVPSPKTDPEGYKTWCKNNKACFNCGSKKHRVKDCPKKDSNRKSEKADKADKADKKESGKA
jgi:Retrotransposon gag protein